MQSVRSAAITGLGLVLVALAAPRAAKAQVQSISLRGGFNIGAPASIYDNRVTIDRSRISPEGEDDRLARTETRYTERMDAPMALFGEVWLGLSPALHAGLRGSFGTSSTSTRFSGGGGGEQLLSRDARWLGADLLLRTDMIRGDRFTLSALGGGGVSWWTLETGGGGRDVWLTLASPNLDFQGTTEWDDRSWNTTSGMLGLGAAYRLGEQLALNLAVEQRFLRANSSAFAEADRKDILEEVGSLPTITYDSYASYPTSLSVGITWRPGGWTEPAARGRTTAAPLPGMPSRPGASPPSPEPSGPTDAVPLLVAPTDGGGVAPREYLAAGPVPHQAVRFRGTDRGAHVLELRGQAPLAALDLSPSDSLVRGLFVYGADPRPLVNRVERTPAEDGTLSYRLVLPAGRYRYSLETATPGLEAVAMSRAEVSLGEGTLGRVQMSDLLLASSVTTFGTMPRTYREVVAEPLRCLSAPAEGNLVLIAEAYELGERGGHIRYRVRVESGGAVESFRVPVEEGLSNLESRPRVGRLTYERTLPSGPAAGRVTEVVEIRLPGASGTRTVSLRVEDATDGSGATASRTVTSGGC